MTTRLPAFPRDLWDPCISSAVSIADPKAMFNENCFNGSDVSLLVIAGETDAMFSYKGNGMMLRERAPKTTLVTLRGGSHTVFSGILSPFPGLEVNPGRWLVSSPRPVAE